MSSSHAKTSRTPIIPETVGSEMRAEAQELTMLVIWSLLQAFQSLGMEAGIRTERHSVPVLHSFLGRCGEHFAPTFETHISTPHLGPMELYLKLHTITGI